MAKSRLEERLAEKLNAAGLCGYQREVRFHPHRRWRFDFGFVPERVAVEVEGGIWARGRHTRGSGFSKDVEKYNTAAILGWTVIRVTGAMIGNGTAIRQIQEALNAIAQVDDSQVADCHRINARTRNGHGSR